MSKTYLVFDTETGGVDETQHSLLRGYFSLCGEDLEVQRSYGFWLQRQHGYTVTQEALDVNGIDLEEHDAHALPPEVVRQGLLEFLGPPIEDRKARYIPTGQVIGFDIRFLKAQLGTIPWDLYLNYHQLDLAPVGEMLWLAGCLPRELSCSLKNVSGHLGIDNSRAHTEDGDVGMCLELLRFYQKRLCLSDVE